MSEKKTVKVAMLGCGVVGSQVARLLHEQADDLTTPHFEVDVVDRRESAETLDQARCAEHDLVRGHGGQR